VQPPRGRTAIYRVANELVRGQQWDARDCLASAAIDRARGTKRGAGADEWPLCGTQTVQGNFCSGSICVGRVWGRTVTFLTCH